MEQYLPFYDSSEAFLNLFPSKKSWYFYAKFSCKFEGQNKNGAIFTIYHISEAVIFGRCTLNRKIFFSLLVFNASVSVLIMPQGMVPSLCTQMCIDFLTFLDNIQP